jgi:hypothetical protein
MQIGAAEMEGRNDCEENEHDCLIKPTLTSASTSARLMIDEAAVYKKTANRMLHRPKQETLVGLWPSFVFWVEEKN